MTREIISLHFGSAGSKIGSQCWDLYCLEKQYDYNGNVNVDTLAEDSFFSMSESGKKLIPRALFADLSDDTLPKFTSGRQGALFNRQNMVFNSLETDNLYPVGCYTHGRELSSVIGEQLRKLMEQSDRPSGFIVNRAVGGGTGSGLASMVLGSILSEYSKMTVFDFPLFSFGSTFDPAVEPLNTMLACYDILDQDLAIPMDNQALYRVCQNQLGIRYPTFDNLNQIVAQVISSLTVPMRLPTPSNIDLYEFLTLVAYPSLNFLTPSYAPFASGLSSHSCSVEGMTDAVIDKSSMLLDYSKSYPFTGGKSMSTCLYYRGDVDILDIRKYIDSNVKQKIKFVNWVPNGIKVGVSNIPRANLGNQDIMGSNTKAVCMLSSSTSIVDLLRKILYRFDSLYRKRAFFCQFAGQGTGSSEFAEISNRLVNTISDYKEVSNKTE